MNNSLLGFVGGETLATSLTKVDLIIDQSVFKKRWWQQVLFML